MSFRPAFIALLLTQLIYTPAGAPAQNSSSPQTRPRRVNPNIPATAPAPEVSPASHAGVVDVAAEPTVRVALATAARSASVSTDGPNLLYATHETSTPAPLAAARVRVEPRTYSPPPLAPATELLAGARSDERAPADGDEGGRAPLGTAQTNRPQDDSESAPRISGASRREPPAGGAVRLTSRSNPNAPRLGAAVYAAGAGAVRPLLDVRAPVTLAPADSQQFVRFNEKPYRGRLEVFANARGSLTVVNVVGLEDYVRGVVPNELSPGAYPAIEALKAQAVAARTYALKHLGQFAREGYDLLPDTRSQVYGGLSTERPLADRAVAETRGRVLTHKGEAIDAVYTSTCGGRTEHSENVFGGGAVAYLRGRECALESDDAFDPFTVKTSRDTPALRDPEHASSARDAALLATHGVSLADRRLNDEWLSSPIPHEEAHVLLSGAATLARRPSASAADADATRLPAFASALARAVDGESRGDVLLNRQDVEYILSFRDAEDVPARYRADVALLLRDGHLSLYPDATLRPRQPLTRARALNLAARLLEARGLFKLNRATARPSAQGALVVRPNKGAERTLPLADEAFLFRAHGAQLFQAREVALVGGEPVAYHTDARGAVDYLEVRPAPNGAAADRFAPRAHWTVTLTPAEVARRLGARAQNTGAILDLRVAARGASRRVTDLEVVGAAATAHVRGGRVRSALGLPEQLFVVERLDDDAGRVRQFVFRGRGWGHGVGLCQVGAYGMARAGLGHEKILKAYYSDVDLKKLY